MTKTLIKSFLFFLIITLMWCGVAMANYFHDYLISFVPDLPAYNILLVSLAAILIISFFSWKKSYEDEKAKDEFITIVTHKFRTPLTGIKWAIENLKGASPYDKKDAILAQIENSNQMILEIVDMMVGFAQFNKHLEYAYEATSLREIVDASLQKYSGQISMKKINFKINSNPEMPMVVIDRRKIQFVVDMLIDNAIKYTPADGSITIDFTQEKKLLILSVKDTGIGIKWSDRGKIFNRFYRSRDAQLAYTDGIGLGLYTAKTIIRKHHGRIWFRSQGAGKGSTFFLALKVS